MKGLTQDVLTQLTQLSTSKRLELQMERDASEATKYVWCACA